MSGASGRYSIEFESAARKDLRKLDKPALRRVRTILDALASDPRPSGARALVGHSDLLRIRVGDYRVIYTIVEQRVVVLILRIAHRREVYRGL